MSGGGPLSILHACWEGHPSGQTRVILDLARGQARAGHRVGVACPPGSPLERMVREAGVEPAPLASGRPAEAGATIARLASGQAADVVNAHSSRDRKAVLWARGRGLMGAAVVFTRHVRPLSWAPEVWWQSRQVDRIIAVSADVARRLIARGADGAKITIVPNGLPSDFLARPPDAAAVAEARARIVRRPQAPVVGFVARRKDQEIILRAAHHVPRTLNIAFVGIDPDAALERLAASVPQHAVAYVPFVPDPRPYYACLDISLIAWRNEGFGLSVLESLALGIPFIGSREGAIPDLVEDEVDGILVPHDDPQAWARAIERLLDDRGLAARLVEQGRRKAAGFTFERTLERTDAAYREAIAARSRRMHRSPGMGAPAAGACRPRPLRRPGLGIAVISERESLGDGFFKLHLLRALRRAYPEEKVTWIVSDSDTPYRGVMARIAGPYLDRIVPNAGLRRPWRGALRRLRALGPFSLAIDGRSNNGVILATRILLRADCYQAATPGHLFCSRRPRGPRPRHKLARLVALLEAVTGCPVDGSGDIPLPPEVTAAVGALVPQGRRLVGLAPGASIPARVWPLENFIALARWIREQGWWPVFLLGPHERDILAALRAAVPEALFPGCDDTAPSGDVEVSLAVSARLAAAVGHDTGASHLMAAAGTPLVTLFGPSDPRSWAPRARRIVILRARDFGGREIRRIPLAAVQAAVTAIMRD